MRCNFLHTEQGYRVMKVEVEWKELFADYEDVVDAYSRLSIPGFRVGKTPRQVVEERFHANIAHDITRRCAYRFGREAVQQLNVVVAGAVEVLHTQYTKGKNLEFTARFLTPPDFDLPDLRAIDIPEICEDRVTWLSHWLIEHVPMSVSDELVKVELAMDGISACQRGGDEWRAAADRVKLMLILKKIAGQEGVEVDEADVEARIRAKATEFGTTLKGLQEQLENGNGRGRLQDLLLAEMTLTYLLERVQKT